MSCKISLGRNLGMYLLFSLSFSISAVAETINVAVASNFATTMNAVKQRFESEYGHEINIITGSSGKHFAQLVNGAPFDLFLSADADRPRQLEIRGHVPPGQRAVYAQGRLVLWSNRQELRLSEQSLLRLEAEEPIRIAMANPALAPYGRAAVEVMTTLGVYEALRSTIVMGENVGQAFQFIYTGNVEFGFVALSQALALDQTQALWDIPLDYYQPIRQEMVLLSSKPGARALFTFLQSAAMGRILNEYGYELPKR
jgi:molybdate transport system substrate-binding protein